MSIGQFARAAAAMLACLAAAAGTWADEMCPAPPKHTKIPVTALAPDHLIHIETGGAVVDNAGHAALSDRVTVTQDGHSVSADSMDYDYNSGKLAVKGAVDFEDPRLRIKSDEGTYDAVGGATFDVANFQILDRNGRGFARRMAMQPDGKVQLGQVHYTTCPVGKEDWSLSASSIDLDTAGQEGVGRGVVLRFEDVPIFYTPYISFPLGDERKSGVLFPNFGHSSSNGWQLDVPYYLNLAPNYDLTLTPGFLSARGVQLGEEFRYLTQGSRGTVQANVLANDRQEHSDRAYFHFTDTTDLRTGLRFDADITSVSDINYFSDFAVGSEATSVTYLERRAEMLYYDDVWRIRGQFQNFQTVDFDVPDFDRPYSRVPRIEANALVPLDDTHIELALSSEVTNFLRGVGPTGVRLDLQPEVSWTLRGPGYYFAPAAGYYFTQYDLRNADFGDPSTPTRALPYGRVDSGLVFERNSGSSSQRTQTLEPRVVYSYVKYRDQDDLPVFDSGLPDLNLTELFRTNRYVGGDRIGDANQLALGLTTRLFDQGSGAQFLSATIGQIRYFSIPRVTLPEDTLLASTGQNVGMMPIVNPLGTPGMIVNGQFHEYYWAGLPGQYSLIQPRQRQVLPGEIAESFPASDVVTEVALTGYKHLNVNINYQINPYTQHTDKSEIILQYRPDSSRVVNLGYRFQEGILKQYDGSFAWPIAQRWNVVGRYVYSLADHQTIEQLAGFEYKSCCYRIQLVQRRYLSNRTATGNGGLDTSVALQLELTGLSSVGKPADLFLQKEIQGYIAHDPHDPDAP